MRKTFALAPILMLLLASCGDNDEEVRAPVKADPAGPALPAPGGDPAGSITGMPDPESGEAVVALGAGDEAEARGEAGGDRVQPEDEGLDALAALDEGDPLAGGPDAATVAGPAPNTPVASGAGATATSPAPPAAPAPAVGSGSDQAMATVRSYYSAISAGDYGRAHGLWSGNGSASGQSLEQFANGFADTADVRVHMMEPRAAGGGAAGSQYITVPVTLDTTRRDGSSVQFTGSYTLRRPTDGSGDWRIDSADLREVQR